MNPAADIPTGGNPSEAPERKASLWRRMGGGSLLLAAVFHLLLLLLGGLWIFDVIRIPEKKDVDFALAPGSSGGGGSPREVTKKQQMKMMPSVASKRVFAEGVTSDFSIPEPGDSFGDMSSMGNLAGGLSGGGLGGSGSGGGSGNGNGGGFGNGPGGAAGLGNGLPGLKLFGMDLNVRSIGVVLDVSGSMRNDLPQVLREINRVAKDCPVILHVGCGLGEIRGDAVSAIKPVDAPDDAFRRFWFGAQGSNSGERVYRMLARRKMTFFHEGSGTRSTAQAILSAELKDVEAVYWFADFQDNITREATEALRDELIKRKQKLFIHALEEGPNFRPANELIAEPTGGGKIKRTTRI